MTISVGLRKIRANAQEPVYATHGSAGADLYACLDHSEAVVLQPGERVLVPTGLSFVIPACHEGQIRPRSGRAAQQGLTVLNSPGTVDSDYRGEVMVLLYNAGEAPASVRHGDRIAQLVITPVERAIWVVREDQIARVPEADQDRGGGFGSTEHLQLELPFFGE